MRLIILFVLLIPTIGVGQQSLRVSLDKTSLTLYHISDNEIINSKNFANDNRYNVMLNNIEHYCDSSHIKDCWITISPEINNPTSQEVKRIFSKYEVVQLDTISEKIFTAQSAFPNIEDAIFLNFDENSMYFAYARMHDQKSFWQIIPIELSVVRAFNDSATTEKRREIVFSLREMLDEQKIYKHLNERTLYVSGNIWRAIATKSYPGVSRSYTLLSFDNVMATSDFWKKNWSSWSDNKVYEECALLFDKETAISRITLLIQTLWWNPSDQVLLPRSVIYARTVNPALGISR